MTRGPRFRLPEHPWPSEGEIAQELDLKAHAICLALGAHSCEGRIYGVRQGPRAAAILLGRCQRCGLGVITDGS